MPKKSKEPTVSAPQEKKSAKAAQKTAAKTSTKVPAKKDPLPAPPVAAKEPAKAPSKKEGKKKEPTPAPAPAPTPAPTPASVKTSKSAKAPKAAKTLDKAQEIVIPLEDISLRAYFIAERRQKMGWPGDSASDWLEAETQLKAELVRGKKKAAK